MKVGERVGAIASGTKDSITLLGYGVYLGDEVPPNPLASVVAGRLNPKIQLDNGDIVWGCECWWGPELEIMKKCGGKQIIQISVAELRKKAEAEPLTEEESKTCAKILDEHQEKKTATKEELKEVIDLMLDYGLIDEQRHAKWNEQVNQGQPLSV